MSGKGSGAGVDVEGNAAVLLGNEREDGDPVVVVHRGHEHLRDTMLVNLSKSDSQPHAPR